MKKFVHVLLVMCCIAALCVSCQTVEKPAEIDAERQAEIMLADQGVLALDWVQQSGEYRALCYQAFNTARVAFDWAKADKPKAVIVDLDETMIDNSPEGAYRAIEHMNFEGPLWTEWCAAAEAPEVPGAVEFANYVNDHGGKVFYVSNRKAAKEYDGTVKNLKALGFPEVDENSVLLKGDTSKKVERFQKVLDQGYDVVLYIGDNLDDFDTTPDTYHQLNEVRRQVVDREKANYGVKYIMLPNPVYGGWESGLGDNYWNSSEGMVQYRMDGLIPWQR